MNAGASDLVAPWPSVVTLVRHAPHCTESRHGFGVSYVSTLPACGCVPQKRHYDARSSRKKKR